MFNNEDVSIGSWMLAMNVHHEDNRAICDPRCTPTSIAVWDIPRCSGSTIILINPGIFYFVNEMSECDKCLECEGFTAIFMIHMFLLLFLSY